jgi:hypothetical protein
MFNITREAVQGEWSFLAKGLTVRFQSMRSRQRHFNVGIVEEYILMTSSPDELANSTPTEFRWRGRESERQEALQTERAR